MLNANIIRAWKDESYRSSLSEGERTSMPENPAGIIDLSASDLDCIEGGVMARKYTAHGLTYHCCCFTCHILC